MPTRSPCVFAWEKILHIQRLAAPNKILSEFKEVIEHLQVLTKKKKTHRNPKKSLRPLWFGVCACVSMLPNFFKTITFINFLSTKIVHAHHTSLKKCQ